MPRLLLPVFALSLLASCLLLPGCAGQDPPPSGGIASARPRDRFDNAYRGLRFKESGCAALGDPDCCTRLRANLQSALDRHETANVARNLDLLAIACPAARAEATAQLEYGPPPFAHEDAATVAVKFRAAIDPSDRIYWTSAFVDGTYHVGTPIEPGARVIEVQMHVLSTGAAGGEAALYRVNASKPLQLAAKEQRVLEVVLRRRQAGAASGGEPFALEVIERPAKKPSLAGATDTAPVITKVGRRKTLQAPTFPREFSRTEPWWTMLEVCVSPQGQVDTVRSLARNVHPRLFALLFDAFSRAEYEPWAVNGTDVPSCQKVRFQLNFD